MSADALGASITDMSVDPYVQLGFSTTTLRTEPEIAAHAHNSRMFRVGANFVNTVVGAGIVGLPHTLKRSGLGLGLSMMVGACVATHYSIFLLVRLSRELRVTTYEQACFAVFGRPGYILVCACLLVFDFGACLSYLLIMADAAASAATQLWPNSELSAHDGSMHDVVLLAMAPLLLLPCMQRDLSALERWSAFSVLLCVLLAAFVGWQFASLGGSLAGGEDGGPLDPLRFAQPGFASAFGTVAFSFVNNDTALLLYATLRRPTERRWKLVSAASLAVALAICAVFAALGYLTFRERVSENILNDYPSDSAAILVMRLLYALSMATTYPTTFFVVRHVCNELIYAGSEGHATVQDNPRMRHVALTLAIFVVSFALALARVRLGLVMSLTGGCAGVLIAFVLPPALWLRANSSAYSPLLWRNQGAIFASACELGPAMAMLLFGACMAVLAPVQTIVCAAAPSQYPNLC